MERTGSCTGVVAADGSEGEIVAVSDELGHAAGAVDGRHSIDLVRREDERCADRVPSREECFVLRSGVLRNEVLKRGPVDEGLNDRVTRQNELAESGAVAQVRVARRDGEFEDLAVRQRLALEELVIATQRRAVRVRGRARQRRFVRRPCLRAACVSALFHTCSERNGEGAGR